MTLPLRNLSCLMCHTGERTGFVLNNINSPVFVCKNRADDKPVPTHFIHAKKPKKPTACSLFIVHCSLLIDL